MPSNHSAGRPRTAGWPFRRTSPGDLPDVWVDTTRIGHVFSNLLSNALKHTSPGGRIALTAEADDAWVRFHVSDTGEGIPAAFLTRVFEPFFRVPGRRNETGAGLGLAIVKEIVEAHGGTVGVESSEGKGSTFTFTLRRADRFPKEKAPYDRRALRSADGSFLRPVRIVRQGLRKALTMADILGLIIGILLIGYLLLERPAARKVLTR